MNADEFLNTQIFLMLSNLDIKRLLHSYNNTKCNIPVKHILVVSE